MKLVSRDLMPLIPGQCYQLEDVAKFSKFTLIKMLELFVESAWGVADIVGGIRKCLQNYGVFYLKYLKLSEEQKQILTLLAQKPGQAVLTKEINNNSLALQREIATLISTSWLIGGAYKNETAVFITAEIASLINIVPDYTAFHEAQLTAAEPGESQFNLFDDLTQLTAYIVKNPVRITGLGQLSKTALKKIMPRLSGAANENWEQSISENNYPFCFKILLKVCNYLNCLETKETEPNIRAQFLNIKEWRSYLSLPPEKRLRTAMLVYFETLRNFSERNAYAFLEKFFVNGSEEKYQKNFSSPLKLLQILHQGAMKNKYEIGRFGEYYDNILTRYVLEPLFYLGLAERIAVKMPTPWRQDNAASERCLWRLSPLGTAFAAIFKAERKDTPFKFERRNAYFHDDWLEKTLFNDTLFAGKLAHFFPPSLHKELVLQNDMTFLVPKNAPPELIWLLHVFGEVTQSEYIIGGNFSKESIIAALKSGLQLTDLKKSMSTESKNEISPTVLRVIEDWGST
ncbi:MAG: helicase-associated domain-containing protein, partial [Sporomusaceae bacterium]|nr:helicase-associated domain-containing protein [Sporomusaceae bacterium]